MAGLSQTLKNIPSRWLYDAAGAKLFEKITELEEYYPTRTEIAILEQYSAEIAGFIGSGGPDGAFISRISIAAASSANAMASSVSVTHPTCMSVLRRPMFLRLGVLKRPKSSSSPVTSIRPVSSAAGRNPMLWNSLSVNRGETWQLSQTVLLLNRFQPWIWSAVIAPVSPAMKRSQGVWSGASVRS
ncbi:MAG: L-histidine N(alpha)-methyltransferase [Acidobacteria bacterium]|nr:L-histidine N(alpha)-methyltransferase [Acidobacteriota bacterium]